MIYRELRNTLTITATGLSDAALGEGTMGKKLDKLSVKQIREVRFVSESSRLLLRSRSHPRGRSCSRFCFPVYLL